MCIVLFYYIIIFIGMCSTVNDSVPILRATGVTMEGNSVCAHIHGFLPYIYVPAPTDGFTSSNCNDFMNTLNSALEADSRSSHGQLVRHVLAVDLVQKCSLYGYHQNQFYPFLKVTLALPKLVAAARRLLDRGLTVPGFGDRSYASFESNIEYEIRFMIDMGVVGCNWIECPKGKYFLRKPSQQKSVTSSGMTIYGSTSISTSKCQIEVDISYEDFISHAPEGEWQKIAPFRILSFDIECAGRKGIFPEPEHDSIIQIANMVIDQGNNEPYIRNVFTLNGCSPIVGSDVRTFKKEANLLQVRRNQLTKCL